jgi:hypothetical protein
VGRDLQEINSMNARLQDLRDSTARLKELYVERWNAENKPYWLGSVTSRYDALTLRYESLIAKMKTIRGSNGSPLPKPEELGFAPSAQPPASTTPAAGPGK